MTPKGFCTKYALTRGIVATRAERSNGTRLNEGRYLYARGGGLGATQMVLGRTFFESLDDARENAKAQALRQIKALKIQIAKLEKLAEEPKVSE